jgi:hypothetical protein
MRERVEPMVPTAGERGRRRGCGGWRSEPLTEGGILFSRCGGRGRIASGQSWVLTVRVKGKRREKQYRSRG